MAAELSLSPPRRGTGPSGAEFASLGLGALVATYASGLVLLPLAALLWAGRSHGLSGFWDAIWAPGPRSAFVLTIVL